MKNLSIMYNGFELVKVGRKIEITYRNAGGWPKVIQGYNLFSIEDAKLVIDHHIEKATNGN